VLINANSAANFSALIRRAFSIAVSITHHHNQHQSHYLPWIAKAPVMQRTRSAWLLQTVQMRLTVLQRMIFVSLNNGRLDSLHSICLAYFR
jgi:hypothetical protein